MVALTTLRDEMDGVNFKYARYKEKIVLRDGFSNFLSSAFKTLHFEDSDEALIDSLQIMFT